jgi:hypothetical protein
MALLLLFVLVLLPMTLQNPLAGLLVTTLVAVAIATKADWIRSGLFVIVALVPLESLGQMGQSDLLNMTVTKVLFPVALLALVLNHVLRGKSFILNASIFWAFVFALSLLASFFLNERSVFAVTSMRRYLSALAFYVFTLHAIRGPKDVRNLFAVLIGACAFSAGIGLVGHLLGAGPMSSRVVWIGSDRLIGLSTVNPNTYAAQLSVALWLSLGLLVWEKRLRYMALLWMAILVFLLAIVMTYSRAVVVCLALSGVHFAFKYGMARRGFRIVAVAAVIGVCLLPLIPENYGERLMSLINEDVHTDSSLQRRWSYHVIGLHLLENNPLMGVGPGNFQQEYMSESFRYETDTFQGGRLLHNLYLSIAAQSGLITLIAFVFLGVTTLRSLWRMQGSRYEPGIQRISVMLEMGLVSFLLNSFFLPHEYQKYLWLLLALPPALEWAVAHNPAGPRRTDREDPAPLPQGTEAAAFQSRITQ